MRLIWSLWHTIVPIAKGREDGCDDAAVIFAGQNFELTWVEQHGSAVIADLDFDSSEGLRFHVKATLATLEPMQFFALRSGCGCGFRFQIRFELVFLFLLELREVFLLGIRHDYLPCAFMGQSQLSPSLSK